LPTGGLGGGGGGGNGGLAPSQNGNSGTANTGGGGGGAEFEGTSAGTGGSGIVIIRYPSSLLPPTSTTGSPQVNYADGYQIYTFTSSGTITF
jgi:hypothetical protein